MLYGNPSEWVPINIHRQLGVKMVHTCMGICLNSIVTDKYSPAIRQTLATKKGSYMLWEFVWTE